MIKMETQTDITFPCQVTIGERVLIYWKEIEEEELKSGALPFGTGHPSQPLWLRSREQEVWATISVKPFYEISSWGKIRIKQTGELIKISESHHRQKIREIAPLYDNPFAPHPRNDPTRTILQISKLVADAFVINPDPEHFDQVDHKDRNPRNNYYKNLRWCDNSLNTANRGKKSNGIFSRFKGVYLRNCKKGYWSYTSRIGNGLSGYSFSSPSENLCAHWYDKMSKELFGEFAYTNFQDKEAQTIEF
jgi:hypothetical protein